MGLIRDTDASRMPFRDRAFDLVLFSMALHEFDPATRARALAEARRVAKDEGRILVLDYRAEPASFPFGCWYRAGITCVERLAGDDHFRHQRQYLSAGGIPALAAQQRLVIEAMRVFRFGTFGLYLLRPDGSR
jgi:ubiquinone/menaquinone biosynthesis C-methylase UbiE